MSMDLLKIADEMNAEILRIRAELEAERAARVATRQRLWEQGRLHHEAFDWALALNVLRETAERERDTYKMQAEYRLGMEYQRDQLAERLDAECRRAEAATQERDNWHEGWRSQALTIQYLENGLDAERRRAEEAEQEQSKLRAERAFSQANHEGFCPEMGEWRRRAEALAGMVQSGLVAAEREQELQLSRGESIDAALGIWMARARRALAGEPETANG